MALFNVVDRSTGEVQSSHPSKRKAKVARNAMTGGAARYKVSPGPEHAAAGQALSSSDDQANNDADNHDSRDESDPDQDAANQTFGVKSVLHLGNSGT